LEFVDFFIFFLLFPPLKRHQPKSMEVEVEENGASAGRGCVVQGGEGGAEMEVEDGEDGASAGRKVRRL
jgi:hypothetical protein